MTDLPVVKLKALVSFPAQVLDGAGVDVTKLNGAYRFDIAYDDFAPPVASVTDPTHQNILLWNNITNTYVLAPVSAVGAGGAVPEAPNDGVQYGRQSLNWTPIISGGGGGTPSNTNPIMDGVAAPGVLITYSRGDHVHPSDTSKAALVHTHLAANITDFSEAVDDRVAGPGGLMVAGANITLTYNDVANTLTVSATTGGGGGGDVSGPVSAVDGHVALFDGISGKLIRDGGPFVAGGDVAGPVSAVDNRIAVFNGATGKVIKDGGVLVSSLQPLDAELTALAGLTGAALQVPIFTGPGAATTITVTAAAQSVLDDATTGAMLATLGGQPSDAFLTSIGLLGTAANRMIYITGPDTAAELAFPATSQHPDRGGPRRRCHQVGRHQRCHCAAAQHRQHLDRHTGLRRDCGRLCGWRQHRLGRRCRAGRDGGDGDRQHHDGRADQRRRWSRLHPPVLAGHRVAAHGGVDAANFKLNGGASGIPVISVGSGAVDRFTFIGRAGTCWKRSVAHRTSEPDERTLADPGWTSGGWRCAACRLSDRAVAAVSRRR